MLFLFLGLAGSCPTVQAQVSYLEYIGSTEIELMSFLDQAEGRPVVHRVDERIKVKKEGLDVTYVLTNGKVCAITFSEFYPSEQLAIDAYNKSMNYLYRRGIAVREVRNEPHYRVIQGRGQGLSAHVSLLPTDGRYRMDAALTCLN